MKTPGILLLALPLCAFAQDAPTQQNKFAGSTACNTCHPDVSLNFFKNRHLQTGCEGCHGPGAAHIAAKGGKATIRAFSLMGPDQVLNTCLECHSKDISRTNIRRSEHTEADVVCSNCHSIHKAQTPRFLLARQQTQLCYTCHVSVRAQFDMPVKHRVNEGVVQCTDCHNPHGPVAPTWGTGTGTAMLAPARDNEMPCMKCHVDKRGPFVFEHASVRVDGCGTCHAPHGSTNAKLLRRPVVFTVCLECHNGAGTFGTQNSSVVTQSASHNLLDPKYQKCTLCHVRIHGSNTDPTFLR
jgi:DmsE family decaheme c-type cytochrome